MSTKVHKAMLFAVDRHGLQVRKYTGDPYWKHLAEVAAITQSAANVSEEMIVAAWLHDVVEDTETSLDEIRQLFGVEVARLVQGVTDVSRPEDGKRATRKAMDRDHLADGCERTQTIKLADLISNTASISSHDPSFAKVYLREKTELLDVLDKGDPDLHLLASRTLKSALEHI